MVVSYRNLISPCSSRIVSLAPVKNGLINEIFRKVYVVSHVVCEMLKANKLIELASLTHQHQKATSL